MSNDSAGRDEFEKWCKANGMDIGRNMSIDGAYTFRQTNFAWQAWRAALSRQSAQGAEAVAEINVTNGCTSVHGRQLIALPHGTKLYAAPPDTVPRAELEAMHQKLKNAEDAKGIATLAYGQASAELEQYRKDAERWRTIAGLLLWSPQIDGEVKWSMQIKMPEPDMNNPKAALTEVIDRAGQEGK